MFIGAAKSKYSPGKVKLLGIRIDGLEGKYMVKRKFENVDIIDSLRIITDRNTRAYKEDLDYDIEKLRYCSAKGEKWFMWMSREHGTYCFSEWDVWLRETPQNITWRYYAKDYFDGVKAFLVEVKSSGEKLIGNLYELDYLENIKEIEKAAFDAKYVDFIYKEGTRRRVYQGSMTKRRYMDEPDEEYGVCQTYQLLPENEEEYRSFLRNFHYMVDKKSNKSSFAQYIKSLCAA